MTNYHHSLFLEWSDVVGASFLDQKSFWDQFLEGRQNPLAKTWLELSSHVDAAIHHEVSDSRYTQHLDKLGKIWLALGLRAESYLAGQQGMQHLYVHGASARVHDDAYLNNALEDSSGVLVSPMTTPSAALNCVAKSLQSPHMSKLVSATCISFAAALEDFMVHRDHSEDAGFLLLSGECVSHPYKTKMYQNLGVYHTGGDLFNRSYSKDRAGMLLADGGSGVLLKRQPSQNTTLEVLDVCLHRDQSSTLTGVAGVEFTSAILGDFLSKNKLCPKDIEFIVGHGSATRKGDAAEVAAYQHLFQGSVPPLLSTKWLTGHLLGGSMGASLVLAAQVLKTKTIPQMPYELMIETEQNDRIKNTGCFLVVGLGFNGQVAAILGRGVA